MQRPSSVQIIGLILVVGGTAVMLGWAAHLPFWTYLFPGSTSMVFNTALCFALGGITLLTSRHSLALPLRSAIGIVLAVISLLSIAESFSLPHIAIDWPELHQWFQDNNPYPGRMAPNTALAFLLCAMALLFSTRNPKGSIPCYMLSAAVVTLGLEGLIGYSFLLDLAYSWYQFPRMAFSTGLGMVLLGGALILYKQDGQEPGLSREARVYVLLGGAITIIVTIIGVSFGTINALLDRAKWVEHTYQVRTEFEEVVSLQDKLSDIWLDQIKLRSDTGEDIDRVQLALTDAVNKMISLTSDNPYQQKKLNELMGLIFDDQTIVESNALIWRQGKALDAAELAKQVAARHSNQVRFDALVQEFRNEEARLLVLRQTDSQKSSDIAILVITFGNAFGLAILLYFLWALKRQNDERNRLLHELRQVYESLEDVYNNAPCAYYSLDSDGVFARANNTLLEWLGYAREDVIGKLHIRDVLSPSSIRKFDVAFPLFKQRGWLKDEEFEFIGRSGDPLLVSVSASTIRGVDGEFLMSRSTAFDITARKEAERDLARTTAFLDSLIENIPSMIFVKDARQLKFVRFNKAGEELLGFSRIDLIGKSDFDFFPKDEADAFIAKDRAVLAGQQMVDIQEEQIHTRHQGVRTLHTMKIPLFDNDGNPTYLLGISRDITEQKLREKEIAQLNENLQLQAADLEEANRELESFSYSVSHDLRAPLRAVDGYALMVQEDYGKQLNAEGQRFLAQIRSQSNRMGALIDDLLHFSRLGRQAIKTENLNMNRLVRDVIDDMFSNHPGKLPRMIVANLPPAVADRTLTRQVWVNLISNAAKYSSKTDEPEIEINGYRSGEEIVYSVKDNGTGFDMAYYGKLFNVFQRLHSADEFSGTGVGLAIVKRGVSKQGGRVWAEGKLGEGAVFFFSLPAGGTNE